MPPLIAAAIAAIGAGIAFGGTAALIVGLTTLALSFAAQALAPKPKLPNTRSLTNQGTTVMVRGSAEPHRIIYGTVQVSGVVVAIGSSGADNQFLHLVLALAGHRLQAINTVYFNDTASTDSRFTGLFRNNVHLGNEDQAADSDLVAEFTNWTSNHRLRGIAYLYTRLKWDANVWVNGVPNIKAEVQGRLVWDPRAATVAISSSSVANPTTITTSTAHGLVAGDRVFIAGHSGSVPVIDGEYQVLSVPLTTTFTINVNVTTGGSGGTLSKMAFSNNASLCQLDYLVGKHGIAAASSEIDTASWIAAANVCDEDVSLDGGGTQKRYTCDGVVFTDEKPIDNMERLLSSSVGTTVYQQGKYYGYAGAFTTPTVTLDKDDLRGNIDLHAKPSRRDLFNAVRGVFADAANFYQPADFTPVTNATYESQDNGVRLYEDIELPFTTNNARAQRIAKIHLERARRSIVCRYPTKLTGLRLAAWDTVQITNERLGWTNKVFRILEWSLAEDLGIDLLLQEEDSNVYAWSAEETALPAALTTTLPNPFSVPTPSGVIVANQMFVAPDGTIRFRLLVSWAAFTDQFVLSGGRIEVEYKKSADATFRAAGSTPGNTTSFLIEEPAENGVTYDVRVRAMNNAGVFGAYATVSGTSVGPDTTAPDAPSGVTVTAFIRALIIRWTNATQTDLADVLIFRSTTNDSVTAAQVAAIRGTAYTDPNLTAGTAYFYWLKSRDTSGNASAFHAGQFAGVSGTPLGVQGADLETGPPATPTGLILTTGTAVDADGTVKPFIDLAWTANAESDLAYYQVDYRRQGDTAFSSQLVRKEILSARYFGVVGNVVYEARIAAIDRLGNASAFTALSTITTATDTTVPAAPTGVTASGFFQVVLVKWIPPSVTDLDVVEIWRSTTNDSATATKVGESKGISFVDDGLANATQYFYWLKSRDTSANVSGFHAGQFAGASGTTLTIATADVGDSQVTAAKIAAAVIDSSHLRTDTVVITVAAQIANALITNAHIVDLSADKITAGLLDVLVRLGVNNIELDGVNSVITIKDTQGTPVTRVQIGKLGVGAGDWGIKIFNASGVLMWSFDTGITVDGIPNSTITPGKLNVSQLSAITADVGTLTAGVLRNISNTSKFDLSNERLLIRSSDAVADRRLAVGNITPFGNYAFYDSLLGLFEIGGTVKAREIVQIGRAFIATHEGASIHRKLFLLDTPDFVASYLADSILSRPAVFKSVVFPEGRALTGIAGTTASTDSIINIWPGALYIGLEAEVNTTGKNTDLFCLSGLRTKDGCRCRAKMVTYTGDGAVTKAITGVGFQPDVVIIFRADAPGVGESPFWRTKSEVGLKSRRMSGDSIASDGIRSLDADGFSVGDHSNVNASGGTYNALCVKDEFPPTVQSGVFKMVSWKGNGTDNRSITGVGFQPDLVWIMADDVGVDGFSVLQIVYRTTSMVGDASRYYSSGTGLIADRIQAMQADGFQIGTNVDVNDGDRFYTALCYANL